MLALALVDGVGGDRRRPRPPVRVPPHRAGDDRPAGDAGRVRQPDPRTTAQPANWPVHVAGHPPGALTLLRAARPDRPGQRARGRPRGHADRGLDGRRRAVTLRVLGAERHARRAAPFLVFGPAAIWQCVSADAMFAAVAAWGIARAGAGRRAPQHRAGRVVAGLLLGCCVMLSYGLPLLGLLAVAVLVVARSWRPLVPAALAALGGRARVRRRSGSPGGRRCRCCASATGTGSRTTARRRTGCGATSPPSPSAPGPLAFAGVAHTLAAPARPPAHARRVVARGRGGGDGRGSRTCPR